MGSLDDQPKELVLDASLLKAFVAGKLSLQGEENVVAIVDSRPEFLEKAVALSGAGFLQKLKAVQQRTLAGKRSAEDEVALSERSVSSPSPPARGSETREPNMRKRNSGSVQSLVDELSSYPGYRIVKELGRGGMGVVYLAMNIKMDRLEVLKVLSERLLDHDGAKERFLREVRAVSRLNHPNIVTSYSILSLPNRFVFAMEHVHGMDLQGFIQKHTPLPIGLACSFAKQLAAGLQHAHEKGLVHRDIKPSNAIVYKSDGQLKLKILDFGLAKATSEKSHSGLTQDGTMLGTPEYMSPEQTLNAAKADIRADIYSLGCTLYCMLTGQPPFRGTHGEVLMAHAQRDALQVNLLRPEVTAELASSVARMMAKDASKRYQTPAEVVVAMTSFASRNTSYITAASNTVNDLNANDRETSVEAPLPSLSLNTATQITPPQSQLTEIANMLGQHRRATQATRAKHRKRTQSKSPTWVRTIFFAGLLTVLSGGLWLAGIFRLEKIAAIVAETVGGTSEEKNMACLLLPTVEMTTKGF